MDRSIPDREGDEKPQEPYRQLRAEGRSASLPNIIWPDAQPSLRSRLMDQLVLLSGRKRWWAHKAARAGVSVEMHVRSGLPHNYPLLPTPEGREARGIIARAVSGFSARAEREVAGTGSGKHGLGAVEVRL